MARGKKHSREHTVSLVEQVEVSVAMGKTAAQPFSGS